MKISDLSVNMAVGDSVTLNLPDGRVVCVTVSPPYKGKINSCPQVELIYENGKGDHIAYDVNRRVKQTAIL
jgi:hypothetical protein